MTNLIRSWFATNPHSLKGYISSGELARVLTTGAFAATLAATDGYPAGHHPDRPATVGSGCYFRNHSFDPGCYSDSSRVPWSSPRPETPTDAVAVIPFKGWEADAIRHEAKMQVMASVQEDDQSDKENTL